MNPGDPLAQLAPLRQPEQISWWPPAPGWWVLAAVLLALLAFALYRLWQRYQRNAYRRQALRQLALLREEASDSREFVTALNALLKSTALAAYPRRDIAAQHGARWCTFLNDSLEPEQQFAAEFIDAAYTGADVALDRERLAHSAECWIRRHRGAGT
ncbi:MAG: DUF4381 domain-containing protein [Halioglobus sp.]|nr:DUF4381 domain-containing protein [Halioglobus sp.]